MILMFSAFLVFINRDGQEIAVVYFREGYDPSSYTSENVCPILMKTVKVKNSISLMHRPSHVSQQKQQKRDSSIAAIFKMKHYSPGVLDVLSRAGY